MSVRTFARVGAPTVAVALALGVAGPAAAHVTITPTETAAGAYTVLSFSVGHGCEGSPTTRVAIALPEEINAVTPTRNPNYDVEKVTEKLAEPVQDAHGNEITERVAQVVYTATTPLPDGERDAFELSLQLPEAAGETLAFPTIQTCEQGETAWTEVVEPEAAEPEHPAPAVTVTDAVDDAHGAHGAGAEDGDGSTMPVDVPADEADADASGDDDGGTGTALGVAGLVAGLLGLAAGALALVRTRRP